MMENSLIRDRYVNPYTDFGFKKLFEAAEIAKFTPRELNEYEDSLKNYRDMFSVISTAEQKGHAAGLAEGHCKRFRTRLGTRAYRG